MKISSMIKWMISIMVVLSSTTIVLLFLLYKGIEEKNVAVDTSLEYLELAEDLSQASEYLTNEVRSYAQFGEKVHYDNYWREVNETKTRERVVQRLEELQLPSNLLNLVEEAAQFSDDLIPLEEQAMQAVQEGNYTLARELLFSDEYNSHTAKIYSKLETFDHELSEYGNTGAEIANNSMNRRFLFAVTIIATLVITLIASLTLLYRKIAKPLTRLTEVTNKVANGDLTVDITVNHSKDEIGALSSSIQHMISSLHKTITNVSEASIRVASSSEQLTASSEQSAQASEQVATITQQSAEGSEMQLNSVQFVSTSVQNLVNSLKDIHNNSEQMKKSTLNASHSTKTGAKTVYSVVEQMTEINRSVQETASIMNVLDESAKDIGNITSLITDIASQTNLLALNAAIEAARAGEHGRGFAVVADEVRKLAEQSKTSADKITQMIQTIQKETEKVVKSMENGNAQAETGLAYSAEVQQAFQEVELAIDDVNKKVMTVSDAVEQMKIISSQISSTVEDVRKIAEKNAASSQEVAGATEEQLATMEEISSSSQALASLATELQSLVSQFKVKG